MGAPTEVAKWTEATTADNAAAVVTRPAETLKSHYICSIHASFSVSNLKLLTLADGTITQNYYVYDSLNITFSKPVKLATGGAATLTLAASGGAGQIGAVVMTGFTV